MTCARKMYDGFTDCDCSDCGGESMVEREYPGLMEDLRVGVFELLDEFVGGTLAGEIAHKCEMAATERLAKEFSFCAECQVEISHGDFCGKCERDAAALYNRSCYGG